MTHDDNMIIRFRGVRGSIPAPAPENMRYGGNTSCVEIRYHDELLILDAGSGIRSLGDELVRIRARKSYRGDVASFAQPLGSHSGFAVFRPRLFLSKSHHGFRGIWPR